MPCRTLKILWLWRPFSEGPNTIISAWKTQKKDLDHNLSHGIPLAPIIGLFRVVSIPWPGPPEPCVSAACEFLCFWKVVACFFTTSALAPALAKAEQHLPLSLPPLSDLAAPPDPSLTEPAILALHHYLMNNHPFPFTTTIRIKAQDNLKVNLRLTNNHKHHR
jgi:hypothetical protein